MHKNNSNVKKDLKIAKMIALRCEEENFSSPQRVDAFLIQQVPDYSRSYFQKLIKAGLVTVNGKIVQKSFLLSVDDAVEVGIPYPPTPSVEPADIEFEIIDQQDDFLLINKPAGLMVHRSQVLSLDPTVVAGLLYRFKEFSAFDDEIRPGIVHRLDKQTSGLLIVARTIPAHIAISSMFKERKMHKTYLAVVKGHPEKEGTIDLPVGRHPVERHKMSHVSHQGKAALTHYKVLEYYENCALVSVRIVTGRTHQIRVHFASQGHGILGDSMYGFASRMIKRQALHAWKLSFEFKGKQYDYLCPVPADFKKLLASLKKSRIVLS